MSTSRNFDKICCVVLALVILITVAFANGEKLGLVVASRAMGYESKLFDTSYVHTMNIVMDDWDGFLETCTSEEYTACSLVIDNEAYKNVAIRGKGNTSLTNVKNYGNNRYSFKVEFDKYDSTKTYHGLDKLCLNNIIQDNTYMKDYIVYTMMNEFGVASPLCSYVYLTVNGEDWGLYLAVEGVEDSFLQRNYGNEDVNLYKPDSTSMGGGKGNGKGFDMDKFNEENSSASEESTTAVTENSSVQTDKTKTEEQTSTDANVPSGNNANGTGQMPSMSGGEMPTMAEGEIPSMPSGEMPTMAEGEIPSMPDGEMPSFDASDFDFSGEMPTLAEGETMKDFGNFTPGENNRGGGNGGGMGGGMGSDDVKLIYTDDSYDSYSNIFDNAKTDIKDSDKDTLISSLKALNEGTDLENTVDIEQVIRYFVVHNFVLNGDSYTGSMIHNYYLSENDGVLSMIPWDYNLAFGGFQSMGSAENLVNSAIDSPVSGGSVDDRPMLAWILNSEEYTEQYHTLFAEFISQYFDSGKFAEEIDRVKEMISPYVEKDPTKFCTYDEFITGIDTLKQFCLLRAQSVSLQLDGSIGSTTDTQTDTSNFVKADNITVSDMGSMGNMGGGDNGTMTRPDGDNSSQNQNGNGNPPQKPDEEGSTGTDANGSTPPEKTEGESSTEKTVETTVKTDTQTEGVTEEGTTTANGNIPEMPSGENGQTPPSGGMTPPSGENGQTPPSGGVTPPSGGNTEDSSSSAESI